MLMPNTFSLPLASRPALRTGWQTSPGAFVPKSRSWEGRVLLLLPLLCPPYPAALGPFGWRWLYPFAFVSGPLSTRAGRSPIKCFHPFKKAGPRNVSWRPYSMFQTLYSWTNWGPERTRTLDQLRLHGARLGARVPDSVCCPLVTMETWDLASRPLLLNLWELSSLRNPIKGMRLLPICSVSFFCLAFLHSGKLLWSAFSLLQPAEDGPEGAGCVPASTPGYRCVCTGWRVFLRKFNNWSVNPLLMVVA